MGAETSTTPRLPLWRVEAASKSEVDWFYRSMGGKIPEEGAADPDAREAARKIQGWLAAIRTFDKGALALRYTPRLWPRALVEAFGPWTSLVVRLACAQQASERRRTLDEAEAAAATFLLDAIATGREARERQRLRKHAEEHVTYAFRAYLGERGTGPSVLPAGATEAP